MKRNILFVFALLLLSACGDSSHSSKDLLLSELSRQESKQKVRVVKKWIEHGVVKDGVKGMTIHLKFDISDMKDNPCKVIVYFEQPKGVGLKDTNNKYATEEGNTCVSKKFTPGYKNTVFEDFDLFIPNKEIGMKKGTSKYYCRIRFYDRTEEEFLDDGDIYLTFDGTSNGSDDDFDDDEMGGGKKVGEDRYYNIETSVGNMEMWVHPDGSCTSKIKALCYACRGTKKCNICFGTGNGYAAINEYMPCYACGATGQCATCQNTGYIVQTRYMRPGEAEAYLEAQRESKRQHARPNVDYSSGNDNRYMEVIEYAPNYTGEADNPWCAKCQKYAPRHSHIKKRIPD